MVLPKSEASKSEAETPSMTLVSLAMIDFTIFLPKQCSSMALLAASTSGSSGILARVYAVMFSGLSKIFARFLVREVCED